MQELLTNKLHAFLRENNPDILFELEQRNDVTSFLAKKIDGISGLITELQAANTPGYIIEEACMQELTKEFKPSKYNYISNVLEEDFEFAYLQFQKLGILLFEIINIISKSNSAFEAFGFTEENEDNRLLRYAITGIIDKYLSK